MKYWIILVIAIIFEVLSAVASKQSATQGNYFMAGVFVFSLIASHGLLWYALKGIDLSMAYPIWSGLAVLLITFTGMIIFKEPFTLIKTAFILCIVIGVIGLELSATTLNDHSQASGIEHS